MLDYPNWIDDLRHRRPKESAGQHVARIVRACVGLSLKNDADRLAELFLVNEDDAARAELVSRMKTNCGTFMRQVWYLAGCDDELIMQEYKVGMAVSWDLEAAKRKGALLPASEWKKLQPGWGLHYALKNNDDHMEFCMGVPDPITGVCEHAGGGRVDNAITLVKGDIRWSTGRPLRHIICPDKMADNPSTGDNPY